MDLTPEEAKAEVEQATKDAFAKTEDNASNVATDAKTAVKNIAAATHKDEDKGTDSKDSAL